MTAPAWMPFYVADYIADTRHLSCLEHGAYLQLIFAYWRNGGVPSDETRLQRIVGLTPEEWERIRPAIVSFFTPNWRHKRIDGEIEKARSFTLNRSEAGRKAGLASAKARSTSRQRLVNETFNDRSTIVEPLPSPSQVEENKTPPLAPPPNSKTSTNVAPSQASGAAGDKTITSKEEPSPEGNGKAHKGYPEDFEAVWREYRPIASPNASKSDAYKAYKKLSADDQGHCWVGVYKYGAWLAEQRKARPDFPVKHLATFINGRGWEPFQEDA